MPRPEPSPADLLAAAPAAIRIVVGGDGEDPFGLLTSAGEVAREAYTEHVGPWDAPAQEWAALLWLVTEAHGRQAAARVAWKAARLAGSEQNPPGLTGL